MKRDLNLLTSPGFVAGLLLLLANDFLLKPVFHNAVTGKLPGFSGLFVFPLFWSALAPRPRRAIDALTALGFVFWKSVYAQPLIDNRVDAPPERQPVLKAEAVRAFGRDVVERPRAPAGAAP